MGLAHLCTFVKLNKSPLFQGVTGVTVELYLFVTSESVPYVCTLAPEYPCYV